MRKILIVEDVELNLDLLVQLLEDDYELVSKGWGRVFGFSGERKTGPYPDGYGITCYGWLGSHSSNQSRFSSETYSDHRAFVPCDAW